MIRRGLAVAGALAVVAAAAWWITEPRPFNAIDLPDHASDPLAGERVFWAGGCASCHASPV
ncbi:MAG: cytochrome C, partial [Gammaproteobacteria bacterium]|nr:cytochrome C [Gammaproteobacteria bacterium]